MSTRTRGSSRRARAGFTAIELMLVLAVLVIGASVVLPSYPAYARGQRLRATTTQLAATIRYAADWSVIHERPLTLGYDDSERTFTLEAEETDPTAEMVARPVPVTATGTVADEGETATPQPESSWARLRLPEDVSFEALEVSQEVPTDSSRMRFLADGRCDDAIFVLGSGEMRRSVRVDGQHGRVRVEEGDALIAGPQEGRSVAQ